MSLKSLWCVSIVDFEQVNVGWILVDLNYFLSQKVSIYNKTFFVFKASTAKLDYGSLSRLLLDMYLSREIIAVCHIKLKRSVLDLNFI